MEDSIDLAWSQRGLVDFERVRCGTDSTQKFLLGAVFWTLCAVFFEGQGRTSGLGFRGELLRFEGCIQVFSEQEAAVSCSF